jgi:hypothetical protein
MEEERGEACYKFTVGLDIRINEWAERHMVKILAAGSGMYY